MAAASAQVLIVGAGIAGLTAARVLREQGIETVVLDKGRALGGRMATRRIGEARFDHGAQHFSARSAQFLAEVEAWTRRGVVREWFRSPSITNPDRGVEPRLIGTGGMRRVAEDMAEGLEVQTAVTVDRLELIGGKAAAIAGEEPAAVATAVVLTPPIPQSRALLEASGVALPDPLGAMLDAVAYDPCLALMAVLDGPSGLPDGHQSISDGPIAWMGDNQHKGTSAVPAVTVHATAEFSVEHLEEPASRWEEALRNAAAPFFASQIRHVAGHRWRFAQPRRTFDVGAVAFEAGFPVVVAGEVFAGARVEGAYASGAAAAEQVLEYL